MTRHGDDTPGRAATWDLLKVALLVPAVTTAILAVVVMVTKLLAGGAFGGLGAQVGAGWLVVNQVPLTVGGVTVGVLPLMPTIALIAGVAVVTARASRQVETLQEVGSIAGAALAGPLLWTALALAVVADGSAVSAIGQATPLPAFGHTLLVQAIGVAIGVGRRCLQPLFDNYEFPVTERVGARAGLLGFVCLSTGGALLVTIGIAVSWGRVGDLLAEGHSFDGYLGLTLLSILYLPNVIIGALGVSVGATAQAGTATIDALGVQGGAVPPLPILGILPDQGLGALGALVFVLPAAVGVLVGWYCRSHDFLKHLRAVGVAAAAGAALVVLSCAMAAGGAGELGRVGVSAPLAGVYAFAWIAVLGAVTAGIYQLLPESWVRRGAPDPGFDLDELLAGDEFADLEIIDDEELDHLDRDETDPDAEAAPDDADPESTDVLPLVDDAEDDSDIPDDSADPADEARDAVDEDAAAEDDTEVTTELEVTADTAGPDSPSVPAPGNPSRGPGH
ncbi:hypothetical protein GCM10022231_32060 [Gordonia caeni]|uniref:Uncharacterized protein n=1 Tax=Gordonia caeni TaxID=1007097 RepID=A0ABP7PP00_9ACTN